MQTNRESSDILVNHVYYFNFPSALSLWTLNSFSFKMAEKKNKSDFNAMNVAELKKNICRNVAFQLADIWKLRSWKSLPQSKEWFLPVDPNFEKDQTTDTDKLTIHDMLIPNPFSLKTVNNFNFGLCDIFNYFIFHSWIPITSCANNFKRTEYLRTLVTDEIHMEFRNHCLA